MDIGFDAGSALAGLFGLGGNIYAADSAASAAGVANELGAKLALKMQASSQDFNAAQAAVARRWQEHMSNTAYQRTRADLEAAGYNPMLLISNGTNATPSASYASSSAGSVGMHAADTSAYSGAGRSLGEVAKAFFGKDLEKKDAEIDAIKAGSRLTDAQSEKVKKEAAGIDSDARKENERYGNTAISKGAMDVYRMGQEVWRGIKELFNSSFEGDKVSKEFKKEVMPVIIDLEKKKRDERGTINEDILRHRKRNPLWNGE